jgi:hypothetical protein
MAEQDLDAEGGQDPRDQPDYVERCAREEGALLAHGSVVLLALRVLLEIPEAAETLFHLPLLLLAIDADRLGRLSAAPLLVGLQADGGRDLPGEVGE